MSKKEAIVDTCFFNKLSCDGKDIETFKRVLIDLEFVPVVHPYIAEKELDVFSGFDKLVEEGFVRVVSYDEFIEDQDDKDLYIRYFHDLYEEMRTYLEITDSKKQIDILHLPEGQTIFTYRKAGMSFGDIHIILMATIMRLPIILSEDSDIKFLRSVAKRKIVGDIYSLDIYNVIDLITMIAQKVDSSISKKELEKIVLNVKERKHLSEVKKTWNDSHSTMQ